MENQSGFETDQDISIDQLNKNINSKKNPKITGFFMKKFGIDKNKAQAVMIALTVVFFITAFVVYALRFIF